MTEKYTPEKVAKLVAEAREEADLAEEYPSRRAEPSMMRDLADALTAVSADRDRLHKAITEALELIRPGLFMRPDEPGHLGTTRDVEGARRILRAALDKEGEGDGHDAG